MPAVVFNSSTERCMAVPLPVGRRLGDVIGPDDGARAGLVLDHDRLAPHLLHLRGDEAPDDVGRAARWERDHQPHRFGRIGLSCDRKRKQGRKRKASDQVVHGVQRPSVASLSLTLRSGTPPEATGSSRYSFAKSKLARLPSCLGTPFVLKRLNSFGTSRKPSASSHSLTRCRLRSGSGGLVKRVRACITV